MNLSKLSVRIELSQLILALIFVNQMLIVVSNERVCHLFFMRNEWRNLSMNRNHCIRMIHEINIT